MKKELIKCIKKNNILSLLLNVLRLLHTVSLSKIDGSKKKHPKVIQLPITYKCNSRCVMCNVWRMDHKGEATVEEFADFMDDDIFKKVEAVGVNGGEPSLVPNLENYIDEILKLPALKSLNIITNGFYQKALLNKIEKIYIACKKKGATFHVSISLDGVNDIHNKVRGKSTAFEKTISTIDMIMKNQPVYCDSFDLGCTVLKQNIDYLIELDVYARSKQLNIKYRLGIDNKRIESDKLREQYSVLCDPLRQSAKEFFHYQIARSNNILDKFKYFSIFHWLNSDQPKRLLGCIWKDEGITLDARGEISYCAVASNNIGSLREGNGEEIFFNDINIEYRKNIIQNNCDACIHDYSGKIEIHAVIIFFKYMISSALAMHIYRVKSRFML
ncbi:hypothetical protein MNBD_GAMMA26-805 [hydrothermal vent metagenome]|uniref:Radical SAM core domain-containing protein n=1 Tax=hydrothermal vent metagenome TaxID=652676 RepID=A0A3B1BHK9_9ZZZZ